MGDESKPAKIEETRTLTTGTEGDSVETNDQGEGDADETNGGGESPGETD